VSIEGGIGDVAMWSEARRRPRGCVQCAGGPSISMAATSPGKAKWSAPD
jgi:hypothetical protein